MYYLFQKHQKCFGLFLQRGASQAGDFGNARQLFFRLTGKLPVERFLPQRTDNKEYMLHIQVVLFVSIMCSIWFCRFKFSSCFSISFLPQSLGVLPENQGKLFLIRSVLYDSYELPSDSSENPNSNPQHGQISYVGHPYSSKGAFFLIVVTADGTYCCFIHWFYGMHHSWSRFLFFHI